PTNYALGKLYTSAFYKTLMAHLSDNGAAVVQATSPMFARRSYWCIDATLRSVGFETAPYHVYVPSFGEWGFVLGTRHHYSVPNSFPMDLKFISAESAASLFQFPP